MSSFEPSRIPAWLAPVCDERSVSHSTSRCVPAREPAGHLRSVPVAERPLQHGKGEAVDLDEDDARPVGVHLLARASGHALDHAQRVRVVVVDPERDLEDERGGGSDESARERPAEVVHGDGVLDRLRGDPEDRGIEDEHDEEPAQDRERQSDPGDGRDDQRVQDADDRRDAERPQDAVEAEPRQEHGRGEEPGGRERPAGQEGANAEPWATRHPGGPGTRCGNGILRSAGGELAHRSALTVNVPGARLRSSDAGAHPAARRRASSGAGP